MSSVVLVQADVWEPHHVLLALHFSRHDQPLSVGHNVNKHWKFNVSLVFRLRYWHYIINIMNNSTFSWIKSEYFLIMLWQQTGEFKWHCLEHSICFLEATLHGWNLVLFFSQNRNRKESLAKLTIEYQSPLVCCVT